LRGFENAADHCKARGSDEGDDHGLLRVRADASGMDVRHVLDFGRRDADRVCEPTEDAVKQAVQVTTKPLLLSHTAVLGSKAMGPTPLTGRQVGRDHARMIAETGGSIGIWHFFPNLDKYVEGLKEMADVVGVEHVSIGTDQQVAPGSVQSYAEWGRLVDAMLRGGFAPEEAGKIVGGNYVRIFRASVS